MQQRRCLRQATQLLLDNRKFDIEFHGYLSNHVKHALIALDRIEASEERVLEYFDEYTKETPYGLKLHPVSKPWESVKPVSSKEWKSLDLLGKKVKWQEQTLFMHQELVSRFDHNIDLLVQEYAPDVVSSVAGGLTHGIIHLGWAIDAQNEWMVCEGLAYMSFGFVAADPKKFLPRFYPMDSEPDCMQSLLRVAREFENNSLQESWIENAKNAYKDDETFHPELSGSGTQHTVAMVLDKVHPVATNLPSWLNDKDLVLVWKDLYQTAVWLFLATVDQDKNGNFLVLHLISSLWGLEFVCKTMDGGFGSRSGDLSDSLTRKALQHYYVSLISILGASSNGFPKSETLQKVLGNYPASFKSSCQDVDWTEIQKLAAKETEEHNIKLVYVCKELWKRYDQWNGFAQAAHFFVQTPNISAKHIFKG